MSDLLIEKDEATGRHTDLAIWWRWWAIAAYAHVVGAPGTDGDWARNVANVAVGWLAIAVILQPGRPASRTALAVAIVVSAVAEAPLIGNHWWVAAVVSLAALAARPWSGDEEGFAARFLPTARLILLTFYSFAALAKLNSGFLDPVESCARFFANQTLSFFQLPEVPGGSPAVSAMAWATFGIEAAVPILLLLRPTRRAGVWLAILFHLSLTLDLRQHFYDFTLVLVPLFALFAPPSLLRAVDRAMPSSRILGGGPWAMAAGLQVAAFHLPLGVTARALAVVFAWSMWVVLLALILRGLYLAWRSGADRPGSTDGGERESGFWPVSLRPPGVAAVVLVAVVLLNGLSPYLELKSATGFNMYANLLTANGESNHLVIRRTAGLRGGQGETVEIVESNDDGLASYADSGFTLPVANLADYLADHLDDDPDLTVTYRLADGTVETAPSPEATIQPEPMAWWAERFLLFRAVPVADPPACQNAWFPAR